MQIHSFKFKSCVTFIYMMNTCVPHIQYILLGFIFLFALLCLICSNTVQVCLHVNLSPLKQKFICRSMIELLDVGLVGFDNKLPVPGVALLQQFMGSLDKDNTYKTWWIMFSSGHGQRILNMGYTSFSAVLSRQKKFLIWMEAEIQQK